MFRQRSHGQMMKHLSEVDVNLERGPDPITHSRQQQRMAADIVEAVIDAENRKPDQVTPDLCDQLFIPEGAGPCQASVHGLCSFFLVFRRVLGASGTLVVYSRFMRPV
ncbi:MAG TPA: hypothetical protein VFO16_17610 [Pseudonocardiaceae bacterium]|nr:hypothetical protein [Pseudonocardiaceae bacterium]